MSAAEFIDHNNNLISMGSDEFVIIELPNGEEITIYRNGRVVNADGREMTAPPF